MSCHVCKILTSRGDFYVGYDTVVDQFCTKVAHSLEEIVEILGDDLRTCREEARKHVYDMRRTAIHNATRYISLLKLGKTLRVSEMAELGNFVKFLEATVAPHQWLSHYPEIADTVIEGWVKELGLYDMFPGVVADEILHDKALYSAVYEAPLRRSHRSVFSRISPRRRPRVAEKKLAGRYLSQLALIANVAGPDKTPPEEIVNKYYDLLRVRGTGGDQC